MFALRMLAVPIVLASIGTAFADDVTDALDQARKAYQAGDFATAKQSADLASQLIGQKNAEGFAALLPAALSGWTAGKAETTSLGSGSAAPLRALSASSESESALAFRFVAFSVGKPVPTFRKMLYIAGCHMTGTKS